MMKIAVLAGVAAALMSCGGEKSPDAGADSTAVTPVAPAEGATHDVNMVLEGTAYKFVPAELSVKAGDKVVFHNVSGGPHNVKFWADSIPAGAKEILEPQLPEPVEPLSSKLMLEPNETLTISFAGAPAGAYRFTCTPHLAMGMNGKITVTP